MAEKKAETKDHPVGIVLNRDTLEAFLPSGDERLQNILSSSVVWSALRDRIGVHMGGSGNHYVPMRTSASSLDDVVGSCLLNITKPPDMYGEKLMITDKIPANDIAAITLASILHQTARNLARNMSQSCNLSSQQEVGNCIQKIITDEEARSTRTNINTCLVDFSVLIACKKPKKTH